jgi:hypothetical protein
MPVMGCGLGRPAAPRVLGLPMGISFGRLRQLPQEACLRPRTGAQAGRPTAASSEGSAGGVQIGPPSVPALAAMWTASRAGHQRSKPTSRLGPPKVEGFAKLPGPAPAAGETSRQQHHSTSRSAWLAGPAKGPSARQCHSSWASPPCRAHGVIRVRPPHSAWRTGPATGRSARQLAGLALAACRSLRDRVGKGAGCGSERGWITRRIL